MPLPSPVADEAVALLADLVRTDTSNPPGHEAAAAEVLAQRLRSEGYDPAIREAEPGRSNLIVRRKGNGTGGGPLMLTGHLDVVPADPSGWKHPPFAGEVADGCLWGRGTVDMKNHLAASAVVMLQLAREGIKLKRDVIFAAIADQETTCALGSKYLVDQHPDLVRAEYSLGGTGAFTYHLEGKRLYPIPVAHRGVAWMTMRAKGRSGHGAIPQPDSAPKRLARAVLRLSNMPLPVHVTDPARRMFKSLAQALGGGAGLAMRLATLPSLSGVVLEELVHDEVARRVMSAALRNSASVTGLRAGGSPNVLPATAEATVDGRLLPGQTTPDLLRELSDVVDDDEVSFEVLEEMPAVEAPTDTELYRRLEDAVRAMDPGGRPFPQFGPGFTDAGPFGKLGVRTYGFAPIVHPQGEPSIPELVHAVDERIDVEGFRKGVSALWDVVVGFCS
jgi:acetylornithine deacetylase/succinyl-diaminopimelate desuccinylase-like protein